MKGFVLMALLLSLLLALPFIYKSDIPIVKASPDVYQGNLVLAGNNVTVIEGTFDINGSIIVEENATLNLKDAFLNFTQTGDRQYNITLTNPSNGNPRLLAYNSTITSKFETVAYLMWNSTATIDNSTVSQYIITEGNAILSVSNQSHVGVLFAYGSSVINVCNSTVREWHNYNYGGGMLQVQVFDSEIGDLLIGPRTINCTLYNLKSGHIGCWSFLTNCSVNILPGGFAPNLTLTNTNVSNWRFAFYGDSNVAISNSIIGEVSAIGGSSVICIKSTTCYAYADSSCVLLIADSSINGLRVCGSSNSWLLNSTYINPQVSDSAKVYVVWYLDARVVDSIGQAVTSASVIATYPNATLADSKLTDANGWARLVLMEKMKNATGEYPVGNYTVEASYQTYSNSTPVNMTGNQQLTIELEGIIVPEFPSFLILPLFMIATLTAVIVYRRKRTR